MPPLDELADSSRLLVSSLPLSFFFVIGDGVRKSSLFFLPSPFPFFTGVDIPLFVLMLLFLSLLSLASFLSSVSNFLSWSFTFLSYCFKLFETPLIPFAISVGIFVPTITACAPG